MEAQLQDICTVPGVATAFVCDNGGKAVARSEPVVLATVMMDDMGAAIAQAFGAIDASYRVAERVEFVYNTWRLFARDLKPGIVCVVCRPNADMSLVRMTVDMVAIAWRDDPQVSRRLQQRQVSRRDLVEEKQVSNEAWRSWRTLLAG